MIKCPRCGFEQPRDRFCAKCGIVMGNFVSKPSGYGPAVYIFGILVILVVLGMSYKYLKFPEEAQRVAMTRPISTPTPPRKALPSPVNQVKNLANLGQPSDQTATLNEAAPTAAAENFPPDKSDPTNVGVDFDLVSRDIMERMSQEGEGRLILGSYSVTVVPQFKEKYDPVRSEEGFHQLGSDTKSLVVAQPPQPAMVFRGGKEPKGNEAIGFYVELTPLRAIDRGMEFKLSIKLSIPEVSGNDIKVISQDHDQTLVVPKGWGVVVAGALPRKALVEGEEKLYETNILKALNDTSFQKGESEFLIVVFPQ